MARPTAKSKTTDKVFPKDEFGGIGGSGTQT
jgi:hypothetical protein